MSLSNDQHQSITMNKYLNSTTIFGLISLGSFATANPVSAAIINGGFENNFNNWTTTGNVSLETSSFGSGTTEGSFQALLTTDNPASYVGFAGGLEDFLGLSLGDLDPDPGNFVAATKGSAIQQAFTANTGDILSFDWNFLTDDFFPDYAFVVLNGLSTLADTSAATNLSNTVFSNETGFQTFTYTFASAGSYTLGIGIVDVVDTEGVSALLIDNVKLVSTQPPAKTPEPASLLGLLVLGSFGIGSRLRRKKQSI
jgi:hypothetical protein